jgi:hypothetical protein
MKNRLISLLFASLFLIRCGTVWNLVDDLRPEAVESRKVKLVGYVCSPAVRFHDTEGVTLGVRFLAAPIGQTCPEGAQEIYVSAVLPSEAEKALQLEAGQGVVVQGAIAGREMTPARESALTAGDPRHLHEAINASSIRITR